MKSRRWLAWALIAAWAVQVTMLWPLPQAIANSWDLPPSLATETEQRLWLGWIIRAVLAAFGLCAGLLLLKQSRRWAIFFIASAAVYVAFYSQWFSFHAHALDSWSSFLSRLAWMWTHPGLFFMTLLFPAFLVLVSPFAVVDLFRRRSEK
jgi:hypothetical protein